MTDGTDERINISMCEHSVTVYVISQFFQHHESIFEPAYQGMVFSGNGISVYLRVVMETPAASNQQLVIE